MIRDLTYTLSAALLVVVLMFALYPTDAESQTFGPEVSYSTPICERDFKGAPTTLPSGLRPDCETAFAIIEFDWAKSPKHYECVGQSLMYAAQTGKMPVCVLLARSEDEYQLAQSSRPMFHLAGVALRIIKLYGDKQ